MSKVKEVASKLVTEYVKSMFGLAVVQQMVDLVTGQKEELMLKYQDAATLIDKVHQMQITTKFC